MECEFAWCKHFDLFSENQCSEGNDGENTTYCFEFQSINEPPDDKDIEDIEAFRKEGG